MDRDEALRMKAEHWKVLPATTVTLAAGGEWRCPNERCGEGALGVLVPHPKDPERKPNRCPTCLATAVALGENDAPAKAGEEARP